MKEPGGEHGRKVEGLFGRIARWYDFLNHFLSLGQDVYWRYRLARLVPDRCAAVLDLAAGTLDVTREMRRQHPGAAIIAADFCLPMLKRGKQKIEKGEERIGLVCANGLALPLGPESVDCVTIAFGIRNIVPRDRAYVEILRVLKPGGRLLILEFGSGQQRIWKGIYNFYLCFLLPLIGRLFSKDREAYQYLAETIVSFPGPEALALELHDSGFGRVFHLPLSSGIVNLHVAEKALAGR